MKILFNFIVYLNIISKICTIDSFKHINNNKLLDKNIVEFILDVSDSDDSYKDYIKYDISDYNVLKIKVEEDNIIKEFIEMKKIKSNNINLENDLNYVKRFNQQSDQNTVLQNCTRRNIYKTTIYVMLTISGIAIFIFLILLIILIFFLFKNNINLFFS